MADVPKTPEEQPNLLLTIWPLDLLAEDALKDKHNASRYQCTNMEEREVRETTPAPFAVGARMDAHLNLTFDNPPKSFIKGWVFGSEPRTCDVVLGKWGFGVSREHFCISIDDHGQAVFQDTSTNGTTVVYTANQKDQEDLRHNVSCIIFPEYPFRLRVLLDNLVLEVRLAPHIICDTEFRQQLAGLSNTQRPRASSVRRCPFRYARRPKSSKYCSNFATADPS